MRQLHKIKKFLWKYKVYALLSISAIVLTTRALLLNNATPIEQKENDVQMVDYTINGVPKESLYQTIDENGFFVKQDFYNTYIKTFQSLNNIPNASRSYKFDFYGQIPSIEAVKATVTVSYVLNGQSKSQTIVENYSIIKNI